MTNTDQGFLFASVGEKYVAEVIASAMSVKKHMPNASVALVTDKPIEHEAIDEVIIRPCQNDGLGYKLFKIDGIAASPYQKTVYLDSDIYVCDDCLELFDMVNHVDLLVSPSPGDTSIAKIDGKEVPGFYPYNGGFLVYRKSDKTDQLFRLWHEMTVNDYNTHPWDQRALISAILASKVQTYTLSPIYNLRTDFIVSLPQLPVKILHGRNVDFKKMEKEVNKDTRNRAWLPKRKRVIHKKKRSWPVMIFQKTLQKLGLQ